MARAAGGDDSVLGDGVLGDGMKISLALEIDPCNGNGRPGTDSTRRRGKDRARWPN
jgi:hypothetical protein